MKKEMNDETENYFTDSREQQKRRELWKLMTKWRKSLEKKPGIVFPDDGETYSPVEYFNTDGFFPGYFSCSPKVLFLGREDRWYANRDRIAEEIKGFKDGSIPLVNYWRRILYMHYAIRTQGKYKFDKNKMQTIWWTLDQDLTPDECLIKHGFAIMNISKYSNDSGSGAKSNYLLINRFLNDCDLAKHNFIRDEIRILEPDIIITADFWGSGIEEGMLELIFPCKDTSKMIDVKGNDGKADLYDFQFEGRNIMLLNTAHFSRPYLNDQDYFYDPIIRALKKYNTLHSNT